ncbi:cytochrome c [Schinkia azotoformans]|uniref:Cytochrome C class I n=1 Tax=Schinkia azotoformans LMG 9581 TaxID=1131731 RepID=K6DTY1_SCHAZ|nr:cytochrome c [Schinkia azotoformans]EKN64256.1 cytochrome C class I [Schinkia azotoformans LMG 9581]MEC1640625.1 cytochrome c [Schinkia azotoformans]MEC1720155.1 cytochrome c [Schinkia azotoformans]MEC1944490.1 cytochrome c [Schinkia azotoformans]MED4353498.1 cytochrome c [Schinkia azotoformans]
MKNPLMPLASIAILGIILMVVVSYWGLNNADKMLAAQEEKGQATEQAAPAADDPEGMVKASCASCHGQNLEGGVGPALADVGSRLSAEEIANIINNGKNAMPAGMVDPAKAEVIAAWLAEQK